ncbi:MAG: polysaccharide biosynthesis tyrosine autokinase [Pseudomonadota bacterium]
MTTTTNDPGATPNVVAKPPANGIASGVTPSTLTPGAMFSQLDDVIDLRDLLSTIWRGKWWVALSMMIMILIGGWYAFGVAEPRYRSSVFVIMETQQSNVVDLESVVGGLSGDLLEINSEVEVLRSRSLMGKVVDEMNLVEDPEFNPRLTEPGPIAEAIGNTAALLRARLGGTPEVIERSADDEARRLRDAAINLLLGRVSVRNVPRSLVFQISVQADSAAKAALLADTIAELYIREQLDVKFEASEVATTWLAGRVGDLETDLENAVQAVADFNTTSDLVSAEALQGLDIQLTDTRERIADLNEASVAAQVRLTAMQAAQTRIAQAEAAQDGQLDQLLRRADTDAQIAEVFDTRFQQILARASLEEARIQEQLSALERSRDDLEAVIDRQSADLIRLQQLEREAETTRLLYETFLRRQQEMDAQQGLQQPDSRILSDAVIPLGPSSPNRPLILLFAMTFGFALAAVLLLIREARQNGFRTAQDLEKWGGYTVLGQIPKIPARNRKRTLNYLKEKPASSAAEAYRNLRTSLMLSNVDNPPQVILSTSCVPGEGKTTNSLALAQNLTGLGKKVLLMEGDIRRRTFTQYFANIPEKGLVSVLSGDVPLEDALVENDLLQASVLAGEKTEANAADIFASQKFKTLIANMRERFDIIIIDTPPVLVVPDARIIAETVDAILFTVQWDSTSKTQVDEAMRMFHSAGQRITGFVLSQISAKRMKAYGYGGRYGAYAGYGASYYKN